MKKRDTKNTIISVGTELIALIGYNATGIDTILKKAGVPKGSFYHYFPSKEAFGLAVIERFAERYANYLDQFLEDQSISPLTRMRTYCEHVTAKLTETSFSRGCLIGNLGQELSGQNELFRQSLDQIFLTWRDRFADCLRAAHAHGEWSGSVDPVILAGFFLSSWEGALLRAKVMNAPTPLADFIQIFFNHVCRSAANETHNQE